MFFSDDLLTSKKGEFGIIWLAATLGPRTKRITRRQLTAIDLSKTCELIAEPPEPMALRLSGCLLVGVARVYNQNYDLFYSDVTRVHTDLRRSFVDIVGVVGGQAGPIGGLDLPGDGKSKVEQITYTGLDLTWLSAIDPSFGVIDWRNPLPKQPRKRRSSTKVDSLPSEKSTQQTSTDGDEESEQSDEAEEDEAEEVVLPSEHRRKSSTLLEQISSTRAKRDVNGIRHSNSPYLRQELPFDLGDPEELFPVTPDGQVLPVADSSFSNGGDGFLPPASDDFGAPAALDFLPDTGDVGQAFEPSEHPLQADADGLNTDNGTQTLMKSAMKRGRNRGSEQDSASEVEDIVMKKKVKKTKTVKFDEDLELPDQIFKDFQTNYRAEMERAGHDQKEREQARSIEAQATALVDGGGGYVEFFHPDMQDFFSSVSKVGKFQWELDLSAQRLGKKWSPGLKQYHDDGSGGQEQDPFVSEVAAPFHDDTGGASWYQDPFQDYTIALPESTREISQRPESERGRDVPSSQLSQRASQAAYPWHQNDQSFGVNDDFGGLPGFDDSFTPGSRLSIVTPLEKRLRSSGTRPGSRRERSDSLLTSRKGGEAAMLAPDPEGGDYTQLPEPSLDPDNLPASQMREDLPDAFQPHMLAVLETQCRHFFSFIEKQMLKEGVDELDFGTVIEVGVATKHVAAGAFYNCLTLATKRILRLSQPGPWGDISFRFALES